MTKKGNFSNMASVLKIINALPKLASKGIISVVYRSTVSCLGFIGKTNSFCLPVYNRLYFKCLIQQQALAQTSRLSWISAMME